MSGLGRAILKLSKVAHVMLSLPLGNVNVLFNLQATPKDGWRPVLLAAGSFRPHTLPSRVAVVPETTQFSMV